MTHKSKIILTTDKSLPMIRVDKSTAYVTESLMKWLCRLPRSQQDLIAFQRITEECNAEESNSFSIEREIVKTLLIFLSLTSYERFDYYHYKAVHQEEAVVIVVGARGQGVFAESLQWCTLSSVQHIQKDLLQISQLYEHLRRPLKPGLYVADLRLVSDVRQIYVQTSTQNPAYLPCSFIRSNSHVSKKEWSWLNLDHANNEDLLDADQLTFYRLFFPAVEELFERYGHKDQRVDYCIFNEFLLEYGKISMILVSLL
jgi:hypothetical protein